MSEHAENDAPRVRYTITKDDEPFDDGTPETHPWAVNVIRAGEWSGACCYETFDEALAAYRTKADERIAPPTATPDRPSAKEQP